MFYATRIDSTGGVSEKHLLTFAAKAVRNAYLAKDVTAEAIDAKAAAKLKPSSPSYTISDKALNAVYFARIV